MDDFARETRHFGDWAQVGTDNQKSLSARETIKVRPLTLVKNFSQLIEHICATSMPLDR